MQDLLRQMDAATSTFVADMRSAEASVRQSVAEVEALATPVISDSTNHDYNSWFRGDMIIGGPGGTISSGGGVSNILIGNTSIRVSGHYSLIINGTEMLVNGRKIDLSKYGNNVDVVVKNGEVYVNGEKID